MRLADVEAARDLGLDARDLVRHVSADRPRPGVVDMLSGLSTPLLAALRIPRADGAAVVGDADYRRGADRLDEYGAALTALVASRDDPGLTPHLARARTWGQRLWDDPKLEGPSILDELQPTLDRLVELRTSMILGRESGRADRPGQIG